MIKSLLQDKKSAPDETGMLRNIPVTISKSPYLTEVDFMPSYQDKENGKLIFNSRITHEIEGKRYCTVAKPMFTRVDLKRFTETEWEKHPKSR